MVSVKDTLDELPLLLARVRRGEEFVILQAGSPVAILSPYPPGSTQPAQPPAQQQPSEGSGEEPDEWQLEFKQ
jgi:antitoxin (DNA-binding transcriptional repressor) of toxin-antitoxin stability system